MHVDWSQAEVVSGNREGELRLRVAIVEIPGNAYDEVFEREAGRWSTSPGSERRTISRYSTGSRGGSHEWGIEVFPIDPDDIEAERRRLDEFVERVDRAAAPEQAKLEKAGRQKRAEAERREEQARELTERLRRSAD